MDDQAIFAAPFAKLGIHCSDESVQGLQFLQKRAKTMAPRNRLAEEVCRQLQAYLSAAEFCFDLPLMLEGTEHQRKVWQAMCAIPLGQTQTYGEMAENIGSSSRAVGQACGNNPIALIVPCHRVVGKTGLGGFMHREDNAALDIKRWLLAHERR
jgi:methylated-DNA-[protein]-cysteine S-methyltransferase